MANNTQDRDIQVAISFDTSGSMHHAIEEVRSRISQMIRQLKAGIPGIEFAVIAHGGYFDENNDYSVRGVNFTSDEEHVADFVNNVENTVGDVEPECYELMLWLVDQRLTWKSSSEKVLVVIGDSYPHALDDPQNKYGLDWKEEARRLVAKGVRVYGVQLRGHQKSTEFFLKLTGMSGGRHVQLSQCSVLPDVIMAICFRTKNEEKLQKFAAEARRREKELDAVIVNLQMTLPTIPKPAGGPRNRAPSVVPLPSEIVTTHPRSAPELDIFPGEKKVFFWGEEITEDRPVVWDKTVDDNGLVHTLKIKLAVHATFDSNGTTCVNVETTNYRRETRQQPFVTLEGGTTIVMTFSFQNRAVFRLERGHGPVYLSGEHIVYLPDRHGPKDTREGGTASTQKLKRTKTKGDEAKPSKDTVKVETARKQTNTDKGKYNEVKPSNDIAEVETVSKQKNTDMGENETKPSTDTVKVETVRKQKNTDMGEDETKPSADTVKVETVSKQKNTDMGENETKPSTDTVKVETVRKQKNTDMGEDETKPSADTVKVETVSKQKNTDMGEVDEPKPSTDTVKVETARKQNTDMGEGETKPSTDTVKVETARKQKNTDMGEGEIKPSTDTVKVETARKQKNTDKGEDDETKPSTEHVKVETASKQKNTDKGQYNEVKPSKDSVKAETVSNETNTERTKGKHDEPKKSKDARNVETASEEMNTKRIVGENDDCMQPKDTAKVGTVSKQTNADKGEYEEVKPPKDTVKVDAVRKQTNIDKGKDDEVKPQKDTVKVDAVRKHWQTNTDKGEYDEVKPPEDTVNVKTVRKRRKKRAKGRDDEVRLSTDTVKVGTVSKQTNANKGKDDEIKPPKDTVKVDAMRKQTNTAKAAYDDAKPSKDTAKVKTVRKRKKKKTTTQGKCEEIKPSADTVKRETLATQMDTERRTWRRRGRETLIYFYNHMTSPMTRRLLGLCDPAREVVYFYRKTERRPRYP